MFGRKKYAARQSASNGFIKTGIGVFKSNPRRCLYCLKPIRKGERWIKSTSPVDPQFGSYSIIAHQRCSPVKV